MRSMLIALLLLLVPTFHSGARAAPSEARAALAKQRALSLERLRAYRDAGQFASDRDGRPASVFRDHAGRLCPMAHLIAASGRMDLVDQVARTNNTLRLADVTEGPLWDWMLNSGLTREEIIRIQGAMEISFQLPNEVSPTILAHASPDRLHRYVVRRITAIVRDLVRATATSLAVAEGRLLQPAKR